MLDTPEKITERIMEPQNLKNPGDFWKARGVDADALLAPVLLVAKTYGIDPASAMACFQMGASLVSQQLTVPEKLEI